MSTLQVIRGDSAEWEFAVLKADGTVQPLTGETVALRWMAKAKADDLDSAAKLTATTANGKCVITDATGGLCEVRLSPADTDTLVPGVLLWDLQIRDAAGKVWTVADGKLLVVADISRTVP